MPTVHEQQYIIATVEESFFLFLIVEFWWARKWNSQLHDKTSPDIEYMM